MEDLAYRRMLDLYYRTEKPLPDATEVARLIRLKDFAASVRDILNEFFQQTDDGWVHKRCEREIQAFKAMAEGGRKGAAKRWGKGGHSHPISHPIATQSTPQCQPEPEPEPEPEPNTSEPKGSGAKAPALPADVIFALGVPLLTSSGVSEKNARSMLGFMRKTHGDDAVAEAVSRMGAEQPSEPVAWLQGCLKAKVSAKPRKSDALMAGNIAVAKRFLENSP